MYRSQFSLLVILNRLISLCVTPKVRSSQDIVVIGGGAVGLEMAGEIATDFPDKTATLVQSKDYIS